MAKFSWLEMAKALIVIAAWILRVKADSEARDAGEAEAIAKALKDAKDAIDRAQKARADLRAELDADPEQLRKPDEFTRKD